MHQLEGYFIVYSYFVYYRSKVFGINKDSKRSYVVKKVGTGFEYQERLFGDSL